MVIFSHMLGVHQRTHQSKLFSLIMPQSVIRGGYMWFKKIIIWKKISQFLVHVLFVKVECVRGCHIISILYGTSHQS